MEGVGARLGRSSTRYGPAPVFTGPVRKWKKKWVHVLPSTSSANRTVNGGNESSHILLYKWTPTASERSNDDKAGNRNSDDSGSVADTKKRKFKYIPVIAVEEQTSQHQTDDESSSKQTTGVELNFNNGGFGEKPDINDVPMEENQ
ncbi:hypothetical protein M569_04925, partial [Genlisea aurea]